MAGTAKPGQATADRPRGGRVRDRPQGPPWESEAGRSRGLRRGGDGRYDQNHGIPGVVYILRNEGLKAGYFKIGCSRRSGHKRAFELNVDANTGTPGTFKCIFEHRTTDCGRAEQLVFQRLHAHRRGKWGQEFFEVELELARRTIVAVCAEIDGAHVRSVLPPPPGRLDPPAVQSPSASVLAGSGLANASPSTTSQLALQKQETRRDAVWVALILVALFILWLTKLATEYTASVPSTAAQQAPTPTVNRTLPPVSSAQIPRSSPPSRAAKPLKPLVQGPAVEGPQERSGAASRTQGANAPLGAVAPLEQNAPTGQTGTMEGQETADLSGLTGDERQSAEAVCSSAKQHGSDAYNKCLVSKVRELEGVPPVDLTGFARGDVQMLQSVCSAEKFSKGPAAYRACLARRVLSLP